MKIKYCEKCRKRETCTEPCAPVDQLMSDVSHHEREHLPLEFIFKSRSEILTWPERTEPKKLQIIEMYFQDHRKTIDISILVGCSQRYVQRIIHEAKEVILQ